ncbi:PrgI family protein [Spongiactinospora sp. TRM90649]|uniref:PrgI family protein n=1 Tax=Spongiactinospora sp. TRM90649 TaxID=3031114 RepID=UPI0023FA3BC8|nr:PrgI family protein [Spongiactinospora sp. TRM90649]MDF5757605.1 PrgI family protein [Spongiactinospora sp. TRM90649]
MSWTDPVRIPADVDQEDRIVGGFTARQVAILGCTGALLYAAYLLAEERLPLAVFAAAALPVALTGVLLAIGRRDGVPLDRYLLAAIRHGRSPKHLASTSSDIPDAPAWVAAKPGPHPAPLRLPARGLTADGLIDLGPDGVAAVAEVSTVSFALRTPDEQDALVAVFGRWLNSLSGPAQILVRAERVDLTGPISTLLANADTLAHPALTAAAHEHAAFLTDLSARHDLLRRHVLLIVREPTAARAVRRLEEAARLLSACGLTIRPLDSDAAGALVASCFDPAAPPGLRSEPAEVITARGRQ